MYFVTFYCVLYIHRCMYSLFTLEVYYLFCIPSRRALALQSSGSQVIDNPISFTSVIVTIVTITTIINIIATITTIITKLAITCWYTVEKSFSSASFATTVV